MSWLLFGAGAQGRLSLEVLRAVEPAAEVAFVDDAPRWAGQRLLGVEVWSRQGARERVTLAAATRCLVCIGHNLHRLRVAAELAEEGASFGSLVHPRAFVQPTAEIGAGVVVFPGALVQTGARLEAHALVNTGAIVEHDCRIGEGASICPGVSMGGRCVVGRQAFVGTGAVLAPRVTIGAGAMVGAGAVVVRDIPEGMLAFGVPARVIRPVEPERDWPRVL